MSVPRAIFEKIKRIIPPLDGSLHKGQSGRVGVLGGALDYTGAPYFAAISALRFGADLSHVICSPTAAGAIKSYSPDLIVHPMLREDASLDDVKSDLDALLGRLHVLVVGPGLGREKYMQSFARLAISLARAKGMYLVLDADALLLIGQDVEIIRGYRRAVLTPNVVEFERLSKQLGLDGTKEKKNDLAGLVSKRLGGVTVLEKGATDTIAVDTAGEKADASQSEVGKGDDVNEVVRVDTKGGMKRCGGQGDVLSGSVGAMLAWGKCYEDGAFGDKSLPISCIPILAAVGASMVTRTASRLAFAEEGRGVVTQDMLRMIGKAFSETFGEDAQGGTKNKSSL